MSMSTFQKVTLVSCLVLCVSLLLPKMLLSRGKKEVGQPEVGPGRFPPMMHRQQMPDGQWGAASPYSRSHSAEAIAKAKGGGIGGGGKSNLMGQIIPIYGFGILLYILYILFKITSKGKIGKPQNRFPALKSENMKRKITDYELAQLQEKLRETEEVMERIVSKAGHSPDRIKTVTVEHEEKLLRQLKEITRVMQEGKLVEGIDELSPEMEAEEASYTEDWEGYPKETYPVYDEPGCRQRYDTIILEKPETELLSPEELAERMEEEAEEIGAGPEPDQAESEREEAGPDRDEAKPDRDAAVTDREEAEPDRNTAEPYREEAEPDRNTAEPDREEAEPDRNTAEPDREEAELCLPEAPPQNSEVKRAEPRLRGRKQISFSEHRDIYHYPKECISDDCDKEEDKVDEEEEEDAQEEEEVPEGEEVKEGDEEEEEVEEGDEEEEEGDDEEEEGIEEEEMEEGDEVDPVVMAESLSFSCQECSHVPELEDAEEVLHTDDPQGRVCQGESVILTELGPGMLRKRNKKEPE